MGKKISVKNRIRRNRLKGLPEQSMATGGKSYNVECKVCGATPTVHPFRLCGSHFFNDPAKADGNWEAGET